jgi:hypothetical protein
VTAESIPGTLKIVLGGVLSSLVLYDSASNYTVRTVEFTAAGVPVNVTTLTVVVTDPAGGATTYTLGSSAQLTNTSAGNYALKIPTSPSVAGNFGLWSVVWIPTYSGTLDEYIQTDSFRTIPLTDSTTGIQNWYTSKEEVKSRLTINDTASDYEIQLGIQVVMGWINDYCQRHFYQIAETRTFAPTNVWELPIDDLVSTPSVVANTLVNLDYEGNGVYNVPWVINQNYQLKLGTPADLENNYNINSTFVQRPYTQLQVLQGTPGVAGTQAWLPWTWPYTEMNRVQIVGTWGWNAVPPGVSQACLILAVDFLKMKDSVYGMQGSADTGVMKVGSNPWVVELLRPYIKYRKKVGV